MTGLPDIDVKRCKEQSSNGVPFYQVELRGLDIFNPVNMKTESIDGRNLPAWMLDTDYNGLCFYASQVFIPKTSAWENLRKSLGANFEESLWEHLAGTLSEPFVMGEHRSVAVKVIDERGNELMVVRDVPAERGPGDFRAIKCLKNNPIEVQYCIQKQHLGDGHGLEPRRKPRPPDAAHRLPR